VADLRWPKLFWPKTTFNQRVLLADLRTRDFCGLEEGHSRVDSIDWLRARRRAGRERNFGPDLVLLRMTNTIETTERCARIFSNDHN
jgi:hypothetical protein